MFILAETEWRNVVLDDGRKLKDFFISPNGIIIEKSTSRIVPHRDNSTTDKHQRVRIKHKQYYLHRLVALAYIPNPNNLPVVCHIDDNPLNNKVSNLKWGTHKDNTQDAIRNGKIRYDENRKYTIGELHGCHILSEADVLEVCDLLYKCVPLKDIANYFNVDVDVIRHIYKGNSWKHITKNMKSFPKQKMLHEPFDIELKNKIESLLKEDPTLTALPITKILGIEFNNRNKCVIYHIKKNLKI